MERYKFLNMMTSVFVNLSPCITLQFDNLLCLLDQIMIKMMSNQMYESALNILHAVFVLLGGMYLFISSVLWQ